MFKAVIARLLQLAGYERCPICQTYTSDWRGYHEDTAVCDSCFDTLTEAAQLTED